MNPERRTSVRVYTPESVANCRFLSKETSGHFQFVVWPVKNISSQGMSAITDEKVSAGALAFVNLDLDSIMKTIGVIGKVVWCNKVQKRYEIGLNFSWWPNEEDQKLLADYVGTRFGMNEGLKINPGKSVEST